MNGRIMKMVYASIKETYLEVSGGTKAATYRDMAYKEGQNKMS